MEEGGRGDKKEFKRLIPYLGWEGRDREVRESATAAAPRRMPEGRFTAERGVLRSRRGGRGAAEIGRRSTQGGGTHSSWAGRDDGRGKATHRESSNNYRATFGTFLVIVHG